MTTRNPHDAINEVATKTKTAIKRKANLSLKALNKAADKLIVKYARALFKLRR